MSRRFPVYTKRLPREVRDAWLKMWERNHDIWSYWATYKLGQRVLGDLIEEFGPLRPLPEKVYESLDQDVAEADPFGEEPSEGDDGLLVPKMTLREVGRELRLTATRVRQIEIEAMIHFRKEWVKLYGKESPF
jgi:hypothetical protein